ncbi:magnesium chelatase ATPase subunit D [Candidatus Rubidus massiliensis]|nr:MAG: ATPase [Chlamydia sp. 32-24]CDZ79769.1 magnesium chelatase ATPase subunit D [Candidatus Rubidus massiliensis]
MENNSQKLQLQIKYANQKFTAAMHEISKVIVGQKNLIKNLFIALLADGHVLIEGLPGLAKTLSVTTLAKVINSNFKRIQFTPDLLPADLIGTSIFNQKENSFSIHKGPIFTNILVADEINRAPAKVQAALLEVMQERQITIAGETFKVANPYMVLATQNPIEQEGTYNLPEAQIDRFLLKITIDYPDLNEEKEIIDKMGKVEKKIAINSILTEGDILHARELIDQIYIDDKIINFILNIIFCTRSPEQFGLPEFKNYLSFGISPRGSIALKLAAKSNAFISGRSYVTPYDVQEVCHAVLRHRIKKTYEAEADEISSDQIITRILEKIPAP